MSTETPSETPAVREVDLIVGVDGSPPALRALDTAARLLAARPPGRITVVWVAHLGGEVSLSADAVAIVENDFDQVASELRTAAAERLAARGAALGLPVAPGPHRPRADRGGEGGSGRPARRRGGHLGRELIQRHAPDDRLGRGAARPSRAGAGHDRAVAPSAMPAWARAAARTSSMTTSSGTAVESITRWYSAGSAGSVRYRRRT